MEITSKKFLLESEITWQPAGERVTRQIMGYDPQLMIVKVKFEKGESITSGGYMAYPNDFSAVKGFIDIIEGLFKK